MCGLVGYVGEPVSTARLQAARDLLAHRGPDSAGLWETTFPNGAVGLAFQRLRILDLSPAADQPMASGNLRLVFNGEIYNFCELRDELTSRGHRFATTGDTEVVLAAYREWGIEAIPRLEGMFALAVWDGDNRRLVLARDRLGIKPLYYAQSPHRVVFASEPKAVLALLDEAPTLDEEALDRFLTFLWVPDPDTLLKGVLKLPPGHLAIFESGNQRIQQYWDAEFQPREMDLEEAAERTLAAVRSAVSRQLVADVPVGVFLSGGLDSTLLAALAAGASEHRVLAVATGAAGDTAKYDPWQDDLPYARLAAEHAERLDYREILLSSASADMAYDLVDHLDDPVADPAAISTLLICRAAKGSATVMLSGVGAEELFAGYPRHRFAKVFERAKAFPLGARSAILGSLASLVRGARPGRLLTARRHGQKLLESLAEPEPYIASCAHHTPATLGELRGYQVDWASVVARHVTHLDHADAAGLPPLSRSLYLDLKTYLPCLNLAYVDRASMACSVEVRVPLLDDAVVHESLLIPDKLRLAHGRSKAVLRHAARDIVPEAILRRPKTGFAAPVRSWMRDIDSDLVRDCLSEESLRDRGLVRPEAVRMMQERLSQGRRDESLQLWALLVFELWARRFLDRPTTSRV